MQGYDHLIEECQLDSLRSARHRVESYLSIVKYQLPCILQTSAATKIPNTIIETFATLNLWPSLASKMMVDEM